VSEDYFVPAGTPVRILSFVLGEGSKSRVVASFAQSASLAENGLQSDVRILVDPENLKFEYSAAVTRFSDTFAMERALQIP